MAGVLIYHNPRCSKSRQTLQLLQEQGIEPTVIEYLKTPPSLADLQTIHRKLKGSVTTMLRSNENEFKQLGIALSEASDERLLKAIADCPKLLQRPIVIKGNKAAIGRPPEAVLEILS